MKIAQLGNKYIKAKIITGMHVGENVYIPRIIMSPSDSKWQFMLKRSLYPSAVCFAMALSSVTNKEGLKLLIDDNECRSEDNGKNIVYKEEL